MRAVFVSAFLVILGGCATPPSPENREARREWEQLNDPAEPANRAVFAFNQGLDKAVLKPVAEGYRDYVPKVVRERIRNMLTNFSEPWSFVNEVLQGEIERSGVTLGRFLGNTTVGILGMFDVMDEVLGEHHDEDFGQTLGVWGVGEGPYLMLPLFGPNNPRDLVGDVAGYFLDPASWALGLVAPQPALWAKTAVGGIDKREKYIDPLEEIERTSLDFYASLRSLWRQRRADLIRNGKPDPKAAVPGFTFDEDEPPARPAPPIATARFDPGPSSAAPGPAPVANIVVVPQGPGYDAERQRMDDLKAQMRAKIAGLKT
ncbi:MAG: VacJ family lipoprotein [Rhodospirillales bacterium]|nr:VacJ family lipoprotein [Rhodospirillales bacterium]